jgi:hypothetical protein
MANGYIGKISALVTASTADLSRKLQGGTREVGRFANSVQSQIAAASRSAQSSFNGIFTAAQKVERALQAGTSLRNKRGIALIDPGEADRIRRVVSVAEGINKPADRARRSFEGLSIEIRGALQPALERMQRQVDFVNSRIEVFGRVSPAAFERTERTIRQTVVAFEQLAQAQRRLGSLATGNELEFSDPRLAGNLAAAQKAGQQAISLPAQAIATDPQISGLVQQINRVSELAVTAAAKVKASIGNPGAAAAATKEYDRLNAVLESLVGRLNRKYQIQIDTASAQKKFDSLIQTLDRVLTGRPQNFDQVEREYQSLIAQVEKFAFAQRAAFSPDLTRLAQLISTGDLANLREAEELLNRIAAGIRQVADSPSDGRAAAVGRIAERFKEDARLRQEREDELEAAEGQGSAIPTGRQGRARVLDTLGGEIDVVERKVRSLPDALRSQFGPEVDRLTNKFRILARDGVGFTAEEADKLAAKARGITAALNSRQARGDQFLGAFGGAGEAGLNLGIDERSLRAIGGQIEFVQNRLSLLGQEARGPVLAALEALRVRANALFRGGAIDTEEGRNELQLLRQELIRTIAAAEGGVGTAGIEAGLNRAGDVGRLGVDKLQLGLQQAAFAVDDFFSVTGDLQQRIRAVGNNLTQLGFIVGNTKGLWIALGGVLALQVISQVIKYANANVEAADRTKALNEALARQKSLVEELAQAFRSLGDTILRGVFTPAADEARQFAQALEEIRKKQAEVRESRLTEFSPDVVQRRSEVQARQREFDAATTPEARLAAATALRQARDREQEAVRAAARPIPARRLDDEIQQAVQRSIDIERRSRTDFDTGALLGEDRFLEALRRGGRQAEIEAARAAGDDLGANRIQREELQTRLREVEALGDGPDSRQAALILRQALDRLDFAEALGLDDAAREIFKDAGETATGIREAREKLSEAIEAGVPGARAASEALNAAGESLSAAQQRIIDRVEAGLPVDRELVDAARAEREAAQEALEARQKEVVAFDSTRQALDRFAAALDLASQEAQSNLQSAQQAADEARRADLGRSTPATRQARQQADADLARQRELATGVEEEVAAARERAAGGQSPPGLEESVRRIQEIDRLLTEGVLDTGQREELARERARLEQQAVEADEQVRRARDESTREAEQAAAAVRGRELSRTDGERAAADLTRGLDDVRQFFGRQAEETTGLVDFEAQAAAQQRFIDQSLRSAAPAIFGLADQVANAVLQGPSRAALEATDVSTVEGSRELNRLLRGDDSARDQNLVELQKQSQSLDELVRIAREGGAQIAD